jgi:hypothetical protein
MVTLPSLFHSNHFDTHWYQCFWSHFPHISSNTEQSIWEQILPCLYIGLGHTQRQARELISGPCLGAKARVLSFSRTQSRAVTDLLIGRNTLRRHLHLMGLSDSPLCRRCGAEDWNLGPHSLWMWNFGLTQTCVSVLLFLAARGHQEYNLGAIWNFRKTTGLPWIDMGHKAPVN